MLFHYTTELRTYFENLPENADQSIPNRTVIENGRKKLFDFDYPIFDEDYRNVFETHFIRKFYMRQIGFETFGLFKFQLETWLIINMPYFNKLFESELLKYDPLTNSKMDTSSNKRNDKIQSDTRNVTDNKTVNGSTNSDSTAENEQTATSNKSNESTNNKDETDNHTVDNFRRDLESSNPDTRLALTATDGEGVIEYANSIKEANENNKDTTTSTGTYSTTEKASEDNTNKSASTATDNTTSNITQNDTKNDTLSSTINDVEDYIESRVGKIGVQSFAKLVKDYRSALLRVENEIFDEMNQLFMLVY